MYATFTISHLMFTINIVVAEYDQIEKSLIFSWLILIYQIGHFKKN